VTSGQQTAIATAIPSTLIILAWLSIRSYFREMAESIIKKESKS